MYYFDIYLIIKEDGEHNLVMFPRRGIERFDAQPASLCHKQIGNGGWVGLEREQLNNSP